MIKNSHTQISNRIMYDEIFVCSQCGGCLYQQFGTHRCYRCKANNKVKGISIHDELDVGQRIYLNDIMSILGDHYETVIDSFSKEGVFFSIGKCNYNHRARLRWVKEGIGKAKIRRDFIDVAIAVQYGVPIPFDLVRSVLSSYRGGSLPNRSSRKRYEKSKIQKEKRDNSYEFQVRRFVIDMCKCRDLHIYEGEIYDVYEDNIDNKELWDEINWVKENRSKRIYNDLVINILAQIKK